LFDETSKRFGIENIAKIRISASNDINEKSINEFNTAGHNIDIYGIGTNLVTCQLQPFINIKLVTKKFSNTTLYKIIENNEFTSEIISDKPLDEIKKLTQSINIFQKSKTLLTNGLTFNEKNISKSRSNLIENLNHINKIISHHSPNNIKINTI
jgi:nicotinic acid phosphoribosyltransferase